jgi:predicted dinucleotide-binding enzyme
MRKVPSELGRWEFLKPPRSRAETTAEEVERLIRTAGFEPVKAGGIEQSGRLEPTVLRTVAVLLENVL